MNLVAVLISLFPFSGEVMGEEGKGNLPPQSIRLGSQSSSVMSNHGRVDRPMNWRKFIDRGHSNAEIAALGHIAIQVIEKDIILLGNLCLESGDEAYRKIFLDQKEAWKNYVRASAYLAADACRTGRIGEQLFAYETMKLDMLRIKTLLDNLLINPVSSEDDRLAYEEKIDKFIEKKKNN
jgi:hypothetical protein